MDLEKVQFSLDSKIVVTGAQGLVGSALVEELKKQGYLNIFPLSKEECDLTDFSAVKSFFHAHEPDIVFHLAASVYGIGGNKVNRGSLFLNNILMNTHVIEASRLVGVKKIIAMGTVAAYPESAVAPLKEEQIWNGPPHESESSYAHVKRSMLAHLLAYHENYGIDFAYVISTNLYGPNDNFNAQHGHVIPSLVRKFYEAFQNSTAVEIWGDGTAARDFLYSKDLARALILAMHHHSFSINIATGKKSMIRDVVNFLSDYFEMEDRVIWNSSMPNGREFQTLDLNHLNALGFAPQFTLELGLKETVQWFESHYENALVRC